MKLKLPTVTLICVDCVDAEGAAKVLEICKDKVDFGAVKLLTNLPIENEHRIEIMPLNTLIMYSVFMLTKLHEYIDTPNVLIVQRDGWILNPESFRMEWLELDYIGPLFMQYDKVGSGGFSLRTKRMMQYTATILPYWNGSEKTANEIQKTLGYYEDGVLCFDNRLNHYKKATPQQACVFAQGGNRNPEYFIELPFGFHRTWQEINFTTGVVDSSNPKNDIRNSYKSEFNKK